MTEFIMLVGLAGSGKSTFAKNTYSDYKILSSDELRLELFGTYEAFDHNGILFDELTHRAKTHLLIGNNVCFDATNLNSKKRMGILKSLPKDVRKIAVVVVADPLTCIARDKKRYRKVGDNVILKMVTQFQMPSKAEGFDDVQIHYSHNNVDGEALLLKHEEMVLEFDQKSKYHSLALGLHINKAVEHCRQNSIYKDDENVISALRAHDLGKPFSQSFDEDGFAHYYGHENVGAYLSLLYFQSNPQNVQEIALLINNHMLLHDKNYSHQKIIDKFGQEFYEKLKIINDCDLAAH